MNNRRAASFDADIRTCNVSGSRSRGQKPHLFRKVIRLVVVRMQDGQDFTVARPICKNRNERSLEFGDVSQYRNDNGQPSHVRSPKKCTDRTHPSLNFGLHTGLSLPNSHVTRGIRELTASKFVQATRLNERVVFLGPAREIIINQSAQIDTFPRGRGRWQVPEATQCPLRPHDLNR